MDRYDVVVVGASIAGCTAATLLARDGLKVALVEAHRDENMYKRLCTHFIQSSATPTIERLGLDKELDAAGGARGPRGPRATPRRGRPARSPPRRPPPPDGVAPAPPP